MASMMVVCRLCCAEVKQNHSVSLFSSPSIKMDLPQRLSKLADVTVEESDGFSRYICRVCKNNFISLEKKLQEFRAKAHSSHSPKQSEHSSRKRVKETAGAEGVSPHTAQARPRVKRPVNRVLLTDKENTHSQQGKKNKQTGIQYKRKLVFKQRILLLD